MIHGKKYMVMQYLVGNLNKSYNTRGTNLLPVCNYFTLKSTKWRQGESKYKTIPGAILSLIIYLLIVIYGSTKFQTMLAKEDTRQQTTIKKGAIPAKWILTADDLDFDVAIGFVYPKMSPEDLQDAQENFKSYLEIEF